MTAGHATPATSALPDNAYKKLGPGEAYQPAGAAGLDGARDHVALGVVGAAALRHLHRRVRVFRAEGRAGDGGGHPDLHPGDRTGPGLPAPVDAARERHHHEHRRHVGRGGRRRDLHAAGAVQHAAEPAPGADDLHLPGRRLPRHPVPHPAPPLLRPRDARRVPLPRGHGHHRGARHRREGRVAGQAAAAGHGHRRRLRLLRHDVPGVEGVHRSAVRARGEDPGREGAGSPPVSTR